MHHTFYGDRQVRRTEARPSQKRRRGAALLGGAAVTLWLSAVAGAALGQNLIVNSDAEAGPGSPNGYTVVPVPSWITTGNFTAVPYSIGGGFPVYSDPGPVDRGLNFFAGGPDNASSSATQSIDLSPFAGSIDAGTATFALAGYLGGYSSQGDNAQLTVEFRAGNGSAIGSATIGPVTNVDRGNLTGLLERSTAGPVPAGARTAVLTLLMTRLAGSYNDGYADNLSFVVTTGPVGCLGDTDCDGDVDFFDIDPFVAKLGCPGAGTDCDAACPWSNADVDQDGDVDFFDIEPFVALLGTTCP